ncbi:MAG TPA: hypothetical protein VKG44_00285, partial [Candidatus Baltobacteraceae bacterium]|nr:hypothetical protein [Candidatus Baltobacteraceae bacterium]
ALKRHDADFSVHVLDVGSHAEQDAQRGDRRLDADSIAGKNRDGPQKCPSASATIIRKCNEAEL